MNVANRTLFIADNLEILRGIDSDCIDLIYLDPPFNTKKQYKAPIGSQAEGASFKDIWTDKDIEHQWHGEVAETNEALYQMIQATELIYDRSMKLYLMAMTIRLFEMKRILKPTGTIYLHCDSTASHYLKLIMDSLFGKQNFRNEIVWAYTGPSSPNMKNFPRKHDTIFRYSNGNEWTFNQIRVPYKDPKQRPRKAFDTGKAFDKDEIDKMRKRGKPIEDYWTDIALAVRSKTERTGYPTQKPLALLDRIIKASSHEGDVVLDPFCGCATACVAAEKLQRQWIGIDISSSAETITKIRLEEASEQGQLFSPIQMSDVNVTRDAPIRTDAPDTPTQSPLPAYQTHKNELYGRQEGHCGGCKLHFRFKNLTIDHIIPRSKAGTDEIENLQLLCNSCNSIKYNHSQAYLYERLEERERALRERLHVV